MPRKSDDPVRIYPVAGFFLLGVSSSTQELPQAEAAALVATGAFSFDPPPDAPADHQPTGPADAGPSDQTEA